MGKGLSGLGTGANPVRVLDLSCDLGKHFPSYQLRNMTTIREALSTTDSSELC